MRRETEEEAHQFTLFDEEPTEAEIARFARMMGMHPARDKKYYYLAREGKQPNYRPIDESPSRRLGARKGRRKPNVVGS
jgi:hypothetical protein